jgi:hypothetical protein
MPNKATNFKGPVRVGPHVTPMNQGLSAGNIDLQRGDVVLSKSFPLSADWHVAHGGIASSAGSRAIGSSKDLNIAPCRLLDAYLVLASAWTVSAGDIHDFQLGTSATPAAYCQRVITGPLSAGRVSLLPDGAVADNHGDMGWAGGLVLASGDTCCLRVSCQAAGSALRTIGEGRAYVTYVMLSDE